MFVLPGPQGINEKLDRLLLKFRIKHIFELTFLVDALE